MQEKSVRELTRTKLSAAVLNAERTWKNKTENMDALIHYVSLLYQSGEFWKARDILKPYAGHLSSSPEALLLAGKIHYILGEYQPAEKYLKALLGDHPYANEAIANLMMVYYQNNDFEKITALPFPPETENPILKLIQSFTQRPYQLEWLNGDKASIINFLAADPTPAFNIEVNGLPVSVFFDTGGDTLMLDSDIAEELNITSVYDFEGAYGGGQTARTGLGITPSVKLGNVILKNIPTVLLPTKRFSPMFKEQKIILGGGVGTGFLRQFVSSLDYQNGCLVLRERCPESVMEIKKSLGEKILAEIPFALDRTHVMLARGHINNQDGLTLFVDSGLTMEGCELTLPLQTLKLLNIAEPERKVFDKIGGAGGAWASGFYQVAAAGLGKLVQENMTGEYGTLPPEFYWGNGYIIDGLISHAFLRRYASWTIDFDSMTYIFSR